MTTISQLSLEQWCDRARSYAPLVARYREEADEQRRLPTPLFEAMREAGLFSLWVPQNLGGAEVDLEASMRVVEELSRLDGSVGWNVMIAANTSLLWAYLDPGAAASMMSGDTNTVIAGTVTSGHGTAVPVPSGFRVSGRWPFASGCRQADWLVSVCQIVEDGIPRRDASGTPLTYTFVLPAPDCEIVDTWRTLGMRGTGSHDFQVTDLFVPEDRYFASGAKSHQAGPLYSTNFRHVWGPNIAAVALGIARDAIDTFVELARTKVPSRTTTVLADRETVQDRLGRAEALLRSARCLLYEEIRATWEMISAGQELTADLSAANRLAASTAVEHAVSAVDLIFPLGGINSIYTASGLERCFRDVHVVRQHAVVSPAGFAAAGRHLLGVA